MLSKQQLRSCVLEAPLGEHVREARDLFNDEAGSPSAIAEVKQTTEEQVESRTTPVSPGKRRREAELERDGESAHTRPKKRSTRAQQKAPAKARECTPDGGKVDVEEELSQLSLQTPKRSNRRKNVVLSQTSNEVSTASLFRGKYRDLVHFVRASQHQVPAGVDD